MNQVILKYFILISSVFILIGCDLFQYSPYTANVDDSQSNLNAVNISRLGDGNPNSFKFAVIADSHEDYDHLRKNIENINSRSDLEFVIHLGDLTDYGLIKEYEWTNNLLSELKIPFFVVLGNHDCLSNGKLIFRKMYGEFNFAFSYAGVKFICFNNNCWEFENGVPDFMWLENQLNDGECINKIVACHVPPGADQMDAENSTKYKNLMEKYNMGLSLHGHVHRYYLGHLPGGSTLYLLVSDTRKSSYAVVEVNGDSLSVEKVDF